MEITIAAWECSLNNIKCFYSDWATLDWQKEQAFLRGFKVTGDDRLQHRPSMLSASAALFGIQNVFVHKQTNKQTTHPEKL